MEEYSFQKFIDKGSFSECSLYTKNNKKYVIKKPIKNNNSLFNEIREIMLLKYLKHDNIISIYDIIYDNNIINIIYNHYDMNLEVFIQKNKNSYLYDKIFLKQMILILNHLNSHNIIHGDIKCNNILVSLENKFNIKLIDFGCSILNNVIDKNTVITTYTTRAPEVFNYDKNYDSKVDIWSAGVVLYNVITRNNILDPSIHHDTTDKDKLYSINIFVKNLDKNYLLIEDQKIILKKMLELDKNKRIDINSLIKLYEKIYNFKIIICNKKKKEIDININYELDQLNTFIKNRIYDILFPNVILGSIIMNKLKKINEFDLVTIWYINFLLSSSDIDIEDCNFVHIINKYFDSKYKIEDIFRNCIKILSEINYKII